MIGRVTWIDYTTDDELGVLVRLCVRAENGEKKSLFVEGTEPYMFAPSDVDIPDYSHIQYTEGGYQSLFGHDLQRVVTETPKQAGGLSDEFYWTGEADVPYYRRVSIHDGLSGYIELPDDVGDFVHIDDIDTDPEYDIDITPRISISDIEVRVPNDETFDEMTEEANQPINVICSYDNYEEKYTVFFYNKYDNLNASKIREYMSQQLEGTEIEEYLDSDIELIESDTEESMLRAYCDYMQEKQFDIVSGWNFTDFDYKYIIDRMHSLNSQDKKIHPSWLSPFDKSGYSHNNMMLIKGLPSFDMMRAFCDKLTFSNWRSKSLEYVSNEELGIGKIDDVDINTDWEKRPSRLIAYNIVDVILTVALDDTNGIHEFFYEIADVSSIPIYDTFYEKRLVDGYVMSRRGDDEILPTADESELVENAGGYVDDPANGRMQNIGVSDLKSLYPSAMITWNISTETVAESPEEFDNYVKIPKVPEPKHVTGGIKEKDIKWDWLYASLDKEGLIPRTLKKLFKKRNREKEKMYAAEDGSAEQSKWDRKQGSTKVIMNSFYGNASSKYWRLSNQFLGDAVTSTARYTLWKGRKTIEKLGYEAVYGDTDSHFIQLTRDTIEGQIDELKEISHEMDADASEIFNDIYVPKCEECNNEVMWDEEQSEYYCPVHDKANIPDKHPLLVDADLHGDAKTCMKWEPEKIYSAWMQLGRKKRYAGNIRWKEGALYEENISISGFENQRSDSPEITASLQKKVIGMILKGEDFVTVSDYLQSVIGEIDKQSDNVEKFALPGSINKPLEEYPNRETPRACMWSNENIGKEFGEGDDPFVYYVKETPSALPQTDVLALEWTDEIPEGFELDKEAIIERAVRKPIDSIINEMDWKFSELRSGKRQQKKDFSTDGSNPFA